MVFEKPFHELRVLFCKMELVLFTVLAGAALRTEKIVRGSYMEINTGKLTMYRFKVMGSLIAEKMGNLMVTAIISSTLTVYHIL